MPVACVRACVRALWWDLSLSLSLSLSLLIMFGLQPKQQSSALLVLSVFSLTYLWFRRGIFSVWGPLGTDPSRFVPGARPEAGADLESEDKAQFALIAAGTHTFVLVVGMLLFMIIHMVVNDVTSAVKLGNRTSYLVLHSASTLASVTAFYFGLFEFFQGTFDNKDGFAYRWARGFFYEEVCQAEHGAGSCRRCR